MRIQFKSIIRKFSECKSRAEVLKLKVLFLTDAVGNIADLQKCLTAKTGELKLVKETSVAQFITWEAKTQEWTCWMLYLARTKLLSF